MLNEVRTLLLNTSATQVGAYVGDEAIPTGFRSLNLPDYLLTVRRELFGATPDRDMLNFRGRQLLVLLHHTEVKSYLADFDSRVTYDLSRNVYASERPFLPVVVSARGNVGKLLFNQRHEEPDSVGRMRFTWNVAVKIGGVDITANGDPVPKQFAAPGDVSPPYVLPGAASEIQLEGAAIGDSWNVSALLRPSKSTGTMLRNLLRLTDDVKTSLFGSSRPTATTNRDKLTELRKIAEEHFEAPPRLAAFVMALVYRTKEYAA